MRRRIGAASVAMEPLPLLDLPDGVSVWTAHDLDDVKRRSIKGIPGADEFKRNIFSTINILGARSQFAQNLSLPLTTVSRLHEHSSYTLYLLIHEGRGVGILKVGLKNLFLRHPENQRLVEVEPMCVLDFFVDESCQRRGFGERLFRTMLDRERLDPGRLAIDRPGQKFLNFLNKHYGLKSYTPQSNNYVVFDSFFDRTYVTERGMLRWGTPPASYSNLMYSSGLGNDSPKKYFPGAHKYLDFEANNISRKSSSIGRSALGIVNPYDGLPTTNSTYGSSAIYATPSHAYGSFFKRPPSNHSLTMNPLMPHRLSPQALASYPAGPMLAPLTARTLGSSSSSSRPARQFSVLSASSGGTFNNSNTSSRNFSFVGSNLAEWGLDGLYANERNRPGSFYPSVQWTRRSRSGSNGRHTPTESGVEYDIINGLPL